MSDEEQNLNPTPSEEAEVKPEVSEVEVSVEAFKAEETNASNPEFATETVTSGPLSEKIRIYDIKDIDSLQEIKTSEIQERKDLYQFAKRHL